MATLLTIRPIERNDVPSVVQLIREFAAFEELGQYCEVTENKLLSAMFGSEAIVEGLIARDSDLPIGYALFFPNFSSFRGQCGFYLDDIYVNERYRGCGVGKAMLRQIAEIAAGRGFERIDFLVLDWNKKAADFYLSLGAVRDGDERHFKFTDEAFLKLAS